MIRSLLIAVVGWLALASVGRAALTQHWKLDDNAASTTVVATTGTNGALVGGDNTSVKATTGPGGSITAGFDLNGTDDSIDISAASVSFADATAFSISAWLKFDAATGAVCGQTASTSGRFEKTNDTTMRVTLSGGSNFSFTVASLGTSVYRHVLLTRTTGNSCRVFVDGTESSSGAQTIGTIFAPSRIGRTQFVHHDGKIAWVKIFNTDESANVATLYAEGVSSGGSTVRRQAIVIGSLNRPYQPTDIDWRCSPFAAFFGALAP